MHLNQIKHSLTPVPKKVRGDLFVRSGREKGKDTWASVTSPPPQPDFPPLDQKQFQELGCLSQDRYAW